MKKYLHDTVYETGTSVKVCDPRVVPGNRDVTGFLQVNFI